MIWGNHQCGLSTLYRNLNEYDIGPDPFVLEEVERRLDVL